MASDQPTEIFSNSRRNFIKMVAVGSAVTSALSAASATTAQEAAVRLPENAHGSYEPPEYFVIETSDVAVLNQVDLVDILQATSSRAAITVRQLWCCEKTTDWETSVPSNLSISKSPSHETDRLLLKF